jgi:hypothetical protein
VPKSISVALVNDYLIVLEGLRAVLKPSEPEIRSSRLLGRTSEWNIPTRTIVRVATICAPAIHDNVRANRIPPI